MRARFKAFILVSVLILLFGSCVYEKPEPRDIGSHMTQKIKIIENDTDLALRLGYGNIPYIPDMEFRRYVIQRTRGLDVSNIRYLYTRDMTGKIYIYEAVVYLRK